LIVIEIEPTWSCPRMILSRHTTSAVTFSKCLILRDNPYIIRIYLIQVYWQEFGGGDSYLSHLSRCGISSSAVRLLDRSVVFQRKFSSSSPASIERAYARFLGSWNCAQSQTSLIISGCPWSGYMITRMNYQSSRQRASSVFGNERLTSWLTSGRWKGEQN